MHVTGATHENVFFPSLPSVQPRIHHARGNVVFSVLSRQDRASNKKHPARAGLEILFRKGTASQAAEKLHGIGCFERAWIYPCRKMPQNEPGFSR
jgi:hypothetical protein